MKIPALATTNNHSFHISGYCAATTPLFALFYEHLGLPPRWIAGLDVALALAFIFSFIQLVWFASALYEKISSGNLDSNFDYKPTIVRNIAGFLFIVGMGAIGFYFASFAIPSYPALYSAAVVGFVLLGSALALFCTFINKKFKEI